MTFIVRQNAIFKRLEIKNLKASNFHSKNFIFTKAQAYKKHDDFIFCFIWYVQQQNSYNLLTSKLCFCFDFFHVVVLVLLGKQQQQKIVNLYTISVCYAWALIVT
jgi:hypothetical protein